MRLHRTVSLSPEEVRRRAKRLLLGLLAAGAAVGLIFGGLAAYAGMWPPVLVVESGSMQHGDTASEIGLLDTGDLAIIQAIHNPADIVTYLAGRATGVTSFGDSGDVMVFADPEPNESAVLLHRAFAFVTRNASGGYDVPELARIPRSEWWGTDADGGNATSPRRLRSFTLTKMGWRGDLTIDWNLAALGANYSNNGFLTFGDRNLYRTTLRTDPWILPAAYVLARVRGEIPWLGLLRLTLSRSPEGCCGGWGSTDPDIGAPGNSWVALEVLLVAAFAGPIAMGLLWPHLPIRRPFRKRGGEEQPGPDTASTSSWDRPAETGTQEPSSFLRAQAFAQWLTAIDERIERLRGPETLEEDR